jgi:type IV secretion system protein VirB5
MRTAKSCACIAVIAAASIAPARAQWAVVDAPATAQLIEQVKTLREAVTTARNQLSQAQQALDTMTGGRGMESLLGGVVRNYLPSTWSDVAAVMQGSVSSALAADVQRTAGANAVLTDQALSLMPAMDRQMIIAARRSGAVEQVMAQQALANASGRFASIQGLIGAIAVAHDQKSILDLQARIGAELGMLQNEQTKLQVLNQATATQDAVLRQREREAIVAGQGRFETRFRPLP